MTSLRARQPRLYWVWCQILARCSNPACPAYPIYGGRGITVCAAWRQYRPFAEWAESHGYQQGLEIDRIDNDQGYCPENCRFTTRLVNSNNRRNNHRLTAFGETKTLAAWSRDLRCRVRYSALAMRVQRGVVGEAALAPPSHGPVRAFGEAKLIVDWIQDPRCRVPGSTLYFRLSHGWKPEVAITQPARYACADN